MPYSEKHNVLFIHIPKCAGKSFEVALEIVTNEEVQKYKWRNFLNRASKYLLTKTRDKKAISRMWGVWDISLTLQHLTFAEIELLNLLDQKVLFDSIKVAIVRNPFDRAVSSYKDMGKNYKNFTEFLDKYYTSPPINHGDLAHKRTQIDFIRSKNGSIAIDNIIRYEFLERDYNLFLQRNKIKLGNIPHIGKQNRDSDYKKYYSSKDQKKIKKLFKDDLEYFGYSF